MMFDVDLRAFSSTARDERSIARLAAAQHGVVGAEQLTALGFTRGSVARRLAQGRLHLVHRGVYAVGHPLLSADGRRAAALLACGPGALLSHGSAAAVWGMRPDGGTTCHVLVAMSRGHRTRRGLVVHHSRNLTHDDTSVRRGFRLTSVARTLIDLGDVAPPDHVRRAFIAAEQQRILDMEAIDGALRRAGLRRGSRVLRELVRTYDPRWQATRSGLELRMLDLLAEAALPEPQVNAWVDGRFMIDFLWADRRLAVETDGGSVHDTPIARREDARRERSVRRLGYRVLRFTDEEVFTRRQDVARRIRDELAR